MGGVSWIRSGEEAKYGSIFDAWLCFFDYSWPGNLDIITSPVPSVHG
jgi:hypothetical protein